MSAPNVSMRKSVETSAEYVCAALSATTSTYSKTSHPPPSTTTVRSDARTIFLLVATLSLTYPEKNTNHALKRPSHTPPKRCMRRSHHQNLQYKYKKVATRWVKNTT